MRSDEKKVRIQPLPTFAVVPFTIDGQEITAHVKRDLIDRSTRWAEGPWDDEHEDEVQWTDAASGYVCTALRHPELGHWCGYVTVPSDHPWVGMGKDHADELLNAVTVEGKGTHALTYSGEGIPSAGKPVRADKGLVDTWGFDFAHAWDTVPGLPTAAVIQATYKDLAYAMKACQALATAISAASKKK